MAAKHLGSSLLEAWTVDTLMPHWASLAPLFPRGALSRRGPFDMRERGLSRDRTHPTLCPFQFRSQDTVTAHLAVLRYRGGFDETSWEEHALLSAGGGLWLGKAITLVRTEEGSRKNAQGRWTNDVAGTG